MKNIFKLVFLFVIAAIGFTSCEKDDFSEKDAINLINERNDENDRLQDSINDANKKYDQWIADSTTKANNKVYLSVFVVDVTSEFMTKSTQEGKALTGASVSISTDAGIKTGTTDAKGIVTFEVSKGGNYAIAISATGYTSLALRTNTIYSGGYYSFAAPLLSTTTKLMTVKGKVTYEKDITNQTSENCAGAVIQMTPNWQNYANMMANNSVANFTYSGFTTSATTAADGTYSITLPADANGKLLYNFYVEDFSEPAQVILANSVNGVSTNGAGKGTQTVAALFGVNWNNSNYPSSGNSTLPVYGVFSAPTATLTPAVLDVKLYNANTVNSVQVNSAGTGYYSGARVLIQNPADADKYATAWLYSTANGQIYDFTMSANGSDFASAPTVDLALQQKPAVIAYANNGVSGVVEPGDFTITDGGLYLTDHLTYTLPAGDGTAKITLNMASKGKEYKTGFTAGNYRYISSITVNPGAAGTGYTTAGAVTIAVNASKATLGSATAILSTGSVSTVSITNGGSGYKPNGQWWLKFSNGNATAYASSNEYGVINKVTVNSSGADYSAAPTATVNEKDNTWGDAMQENRTAKATFVYYPGSNSIGVNSWIDFGFGYMGPATLTLYSQAVPATALTGVTYNVVMQSTTSYPTSVNSVNFIDAVFDAPIPFNMNAAGPSNATKNNIASKPGGTTIVDVRLGTGDRVVTIN